MRDFSYLCTKFICTFELEYRSSTFCKLINPDKTISVSTATHGADGAVGVPEMKWYVAIVNPRHEKSVADKLLKMGIEAYVACQQEMHVWKDGRKRMVDRVVIPSMVFVRCTNKERLELVKLPYILRYLVDRTVDTGGLNKPVAVVPDEQMTKLKFMLGQADYAVAFESRPLRVKDTVRVVRGPLRGLLGDVIRDSNGESTLLVNFPLIGGASVRISPQDVELI